MADRSSSSVAMVAIFLILIVALIAVYFIAMRHPDVMPPRTQNTVVETITTPVKEIKESTTTVIEPNSESTTTTTTE